MSEKIIDYLGLDDQFTRSVALERDLRNDSFAQKYIFTPNSIDAIRSIGGVLSSSRSERAWKIVGPYGSGKSALGVILAQLMAGQDKFPLAYAGLAKSCPDAVNYFNESNRFVLSISGARISLGSALALAIKDTESFFKNNQNFQFSYERLDFVRQEYKNCSFNGAVGNLVEDFTSALLVAGYQGMSLFVDEAGKFIEHAALHPDQGDLIALQQIAEVACRTHDDSLSVIMLVHQQFNNYALGIGRSLNDEWHKVSARFLEIPFDEPVERYGYFAKQAIGVDVGSLSLDLIDDARKKYESAVALGILDTKFLYEGSFGTEFLYPIHPVTLVALAVISKRYGQSERSFHSFIKGSDSYGLRGFAQYSNLGAWYRLVDLYNFLLDGFGLHFRDLSVERGWEFAQECIRRCTRDLFDIEILKVIAVLELVRAGLRVPITIDLISLALDYADKLRIEESLTDLVDKGILVKHRRDAEYGFAISEAVNIEALYEDTVKNSAQNDLFVHGVVSVFSSSHVVATRHYDKTGTIRTVGVVVGTPDLWPVAASKNDSLQFDGWVKLILISEGSNSAEQKVIQQIQQEENHLVITACLVLSNENQAALAELAIWQSIFSEVTTKYLDPWATKYVEGRLRESRDIAERLVSSTLMPFSGSVGPTYWYLGSKIADSERMSVNQAASWLFDQVFHDAPIIVNELINKDRPAPAIVLARQRLLEMLLKADQPPPFWKAGEFPPERLIHTTLLKDTGIWVERDDGTWFIQEPSNLAKNDITSVWRRIEDLLKREQSQRFDRVMSELAAQPLGVRAGPAGVWIVAFLLVNRLNCAIFERGSLVLEISVEHLQRMFKSPQNFTFRLLDNGSTNKDLLSDYRKALGAVGVELDGSSYLEIARRLIRWFSRLPDFTKQTQRIGKDAALIRSIISKATDPIELLTQSLCKAHLDSKSKDPYVIWLTDALTDLGMAYRRLQNEVENELSRGFNISGSLGRIREQLQSECTKEGSKLADTKLKSFILRCTDLVLSDERWLDSVGSLIVQRPLDSWSDDTLSQFQEGLSELCARYQRWMQVVMRRGIAPVATERFVGLTLITGQGEEVAVFVTTNESSQALSESVLKLVNNSVSGNTNLAAAALAQALMDLQKRLNVIAQKEVSNG